VSTVYALHRVEPISREGDPGQGLAAPVHDPLWGLARQRQFGELAGEDSGSPVQTALRMRLDRIDRWRPVEGGVLLPYDADSQVLEAVVAGESSSMTTSIRDRVDAGRRLAARIDKNLAGDLRKKFKINTLDGTPSLVRRAATAYADGVSVAEAFDANRTATDAVLGTALGTSRQRVAAARDALAEHAAWCETTFGTGPATWVPERLERRFELGSGEHAVLTAPAHTRDVVDVADLDLTSDDGGLETTVSEQPWLRRIPTRLRFPGMPNDRLWEFEDAQLALSRIDAATHDLARLALVEFSSTYGNDWFTFPVPVDHGTIATIPEIVVRDTFGEHEVIGVADDAQWSMFEPSGSGSGPHLVVPPVTVGRLAGPTVEEVRFVRDENANLVWGLESLITDDAGVTRDLVAEYTARRTAPPELPSDAELLYRLMTEVPDHWVPFIPVHIDDNRRAVGLVEATIPRTDTWGVGVFTAPLSSVLRELRGIPPVAQAPNAKPNQPVLREEEVGPAGVTVRRRWFLARSADGGRHVWVARSVTTGRGEGNSGLAFDVALDVRVTG